MKYLLLMVAGAYAGIRIANVANKVIDVAAKRINEKLVLRDWRRFVLRSFKRERKERWKRETIGVALSFSPLECRGTGRETKRLATPRVIDIKEAVSFTK